MDMSFYPDGKPPIKDVLIIAMAGTHQIWALFLDETVWWKCKKYPAGTCLSIAGSGLEENRNNSYPHTAAFAQPSGLALCSRKKEVYIADSESSSVRRLSLEDGKVSHVVGGDRNPKNLFAFGDRDGALYDAKLQHLLGLAISNDQNTLFVADTYNHKLKKVDICQNAITTVKLAHSDRTDGATASVNFSEPAGLCVSATNSIYLADTNNHSIKILKLDSENNAKSISKVDLKLAKPLPRDSHIRHEVIKAREAVLGAKGGKLIFDISVSFKDALKLTEEAPQSWEVDLPDATWACVPTCGHFAGNRVDCVVSVPSNGANGENVDFLFDLVTCGDEACLPKYFLVRVPVAFNNIEGNSTKQVVKLNVQVAVDGVLVK